MEKVKTYIQQTAFDGITYTKGTMVDLLTSFGIICEDIPFKYKPEADDLPKRKWVGEHGSDVYIPAGGIPLKDYRIDVDFLYVGGNDHDYPLSPADERLIRRDLKAFIDFLYGHAKGAQGDTVQSGRLAMYNEHTAIGRKDVTVSKAEPKLFLCDPWDDECLARLTVTFDVNDPVTDVTPVTVNNVTNLSWT